MTTRLLVSLESKLEEVISQGGGLGELKLLQRSEVRVYRQTGSLHYITERDKCERSSTCELSDDLVLQQSDPL